MALILLVIIGSYVATQIVKNDLYGNSCIEAADTLKKSKFLDQLQTLESNQLSDEDLQGGSLGEIKITETFLVTQLYFKTLVDLIDIF